MAQPERTIRADTLYSAVTSNLPLGPPRDIPETGLHLEQTRELVEWFTLVQVAAGGAVLEVRATGEGERHVRGRL